MKKMEESNENVFPNYRAQLSEEKYELKIEHHLLELFSFLRRVQ